MRIVFDHQTFRNQRYGGVSLYISRLMAGINHSQDNSARLTINGLDNENLASDQVSHGSLLWRALPRKGRRVSNAFSLCSLYTTPYDVFHATYYDTYFLQTPVRRKPWTFTYHDMVHEHFEHRFPVQSSHQQLLRNKEQLTRQASLLITISDCTKTDLVNHYQIDPARIRVIHHGNPYEQVVGIEFVPSPVEYPYLLFVGNRWTYKNFSAFLKATAPLLQAHSVHLICAGGGPFTAAEETLLQQQRVHHLVQYQPITNSQLPALYGRALAFVFPSLYEGFGFPVLEAFACQCPCVLSDTGALPEVADQAAIYFNPDNPDSMALAVEKAILLNDDDRRILIGQGTQRLQAFSWQKTVTETVNVYKHLVELQA